MNTDPPLENWIISGDLESRAASSAALTVDDDVQLTDGIAKPLSCAYLSRLYICSPYTTPPLMLRSAMIPILQEVCGALARARVRIPGAAVRAMRIGLAWDRRERRSCLLVQGCCGVVGGRTTKSGLLMCVGLLKISRYESGQTGDSCGKLEILTTQKASKSDCSLHERTFQAIVHWPSRHGAHQWERRLRPPRFRKSDIFDRGRARIPNLILYALLVYLQLHRACRTAATGAAGGCCAPLRPSSRARASADSRSRDHRCLLRACAAESRGCKWCGALPGSVVGDAAHDRHRGWC
eukprot:IDg16393t1